MEPNTTVSEVIKFVKDKMSSADNRPQNTTPFSDRLVYEALVAARSTMLYEKYRNNEELNMANYQRIGCIKLEEVDTVECPCAPASGCTFLRTIVDVPIPFGGFTSVTSVDGSITYSYVRWDRFKVKLMDRHASILPDGYFTTQNTKEGVKLYVYNDIHKEAISATGIFPDPLKIYNHADCNGVVNPCLNPFNKIFPIDPELKSALYQAAIQLLSPVVQASDVIQNDSDDVLGSTPIK